MAGVPWDLLTFLLEPVRNEVVKRVKMVAGATAGAKELRQKLKEMKSQLEDADRKLQRNKSEWNWMAQMTDLEYRVEDAIEEHQVGNRISYSRAKNIQQLLTEITQKMEQEGIDQSNNQVQDDWNKTSPNIDEEELVCFVGKDEEVDEIVSLLVNENSNRFISLWGMAGIGKTTMARQVFHRMMKDEAKHFQAFVWVCVTRQFDYRSLLQEVLIKLIQAEAEAEDSKKDQLSKVPGLSKDELITELHKKQAAKRCLIVLDNVWETCDWDTLKQAFVDPASKGKLLITTRDGEKAKIGLHVEVKLLTVDAGWELLKMKTFFKADQIPENFSREEPKFVKVGKALIESCGRLPQAISLLGGVLRNQEISLREWELVDEDMRAYIDKHGEKDNKLDAAITLSYNALPYHLKLCFLYLGILKEDESIRVGTLYHMWIAQGMILDENSRFNKASSLMEIAEQHLSDLASRSIVLVERDEAVKRKKFKTCKLHKSVQKVCLDLGKKVENLVHLVDYEDGSFSKCLVEALKSKPRHLVIHCKKMPQEDGDFSFASDDACERLRSLHIFNDMEEETKSELTTTFDISKFKSLRSLVFQGFKFPKVTYLIRKKFAVMYKMRAKLVDQITELVHLKYLCFRSCEIDVELPSSMKDMFFLDTLDLFKSSISSDLQKMPKNLKHLLLPRYASTSKGTVVLDKVVEQLESLMEFDSKVHKFSEGSEVITKHLERFSACMHDNDNLLKILAAINQKGNKLVNCIVKVFDGCEITETEMKDAFNCKYLPTLGIYVPLKGDLFNKCRENITSSNIACLELLKCEIKEDPMEILGKLPYLTELTLNAKSFVGEKMTCQKSSFPRLKILILAGLPKFSIWSVEYKAMEVLSDLHICDCPSLEIVPDGLCGISTLRNVVMRRMPTFISGVLEIKQKFHKDCHFILNVPSNKHTFKKAVLARSLQIQSAKRSSSSQPQEKIAEPIQYIEYRVLEESNNQDEIAEPIQYIKYQVLEERDE